MNTRKQFQVTSSRPIRLRDIEPDVTPKSESKHAARRELRALQKRMDALQFKLYAEQRRALLICLQGPDASGKDGVVRHVIGTMNPQGCRVVPFKQPTPEEAAHDFLWRIEAETPQRGEVVIFNRSHYEDVIVVRVHDLVPKAVWEPRFEQINDFERRLVANETHILKFFLHISKDEQLERFGDRLKDKSRWWKISEADYTERTRWDDYTVAYEDAINRCSTASAPWFVIPADHKWYRDLVISRIIVETLEALDIQVPEPRVDIAAIRRKYQRETP